MCCGRGCVGLGPSTVPLACMPCGGCVPRGWWGAIPGGGRPATVVRAPGVRRCPSPNRPSSGAGRQDSASRVSRVRSVRAWGPSTGPTTCALAGRRCWLWEWRKGIPGGGAFHHCEGRLRSGAVPPPTARPLGGLLGSATHVLRARVCGCGGPTLPPWPACPVGAACRGVGGGPSPGGVACHRCEWRLVSGAVPPPGRPSSGAGSQGSASRVSRGRSVRAWGPGSGPTACALAGWRCSLWGWRKGVPGGGAFHRCEGRLVSGAVPPPAAHPLERAARVPRPVCPGCGRCGRGDPTPAPQRAPLRAGVARCGGGGRASPGGVPSTIVRGVWGQALSLPRLPAHWAGRWGPPPTCCCRGCVGVGAQHCPLGLHALWGLRAAGVVGGRPRGGWPATVVRGAWCQALSLPRPPVLWSGQPGLRDPCVPGAVDAGVGTQYQPHGVRPCGLALLAVGVAEGRPRGGCFPLL